MNTYLNLQTYIPPLLNLELFPLHVFVVSSYWYHWDNEVAKNQHRKIHLVHEKNQLCCYVESVLHLLLYKLESAKMLKIKKHPDVIYRLYLTFKTCTWTSTVNSFVCFHSLVKIMRKVTVKKSFEKLTSVRLTPSRIRYVFLITFSMVVFPLTVVIASSLICLLLFSAFRNICNAQASSQPISVSNITYFCVSSVIFTNQTESSLQQKNHHFNPFINSVRSLNSRLSKFK